MYIRKLPIKIPQTSPEKDWIIDTNDFYRKVSSKIEFDKVKHSYTLPDGEVITSSVSSLNGISSLYYENFKSKIPNAEKILEKAITRGNIIHDFVEKFLIHNFTTDIVSPFNKDYVNQASQATLNTISTLREFLPRFMGKKVLKFMERRVLIATECILTSQTIRGLVGTFDLLIFNYETNCLELIDIKGSKHRGQNKCDTDLMYGLQLNAYEHLIRENFDIPPIAINKYILFTGGTQPLFWKLF